MNKEENSNEVNNKEHQCDGEEVEKHNGEEDVEEECGEEDVEEVEEVEEVKVEEQQSDGEKVEEQQSDSEKVEEQKSDDGEEVEEQKSIEEEVEEQQSDGEEVKEQQSDDSEEVEEQKSSEEVVVVVEQQNSEEVEKQNESTNNEEKNINEKTKKKKNNKKEPKPKKEIKPKFSSNCLKCNKLFKNESLYNKHTLEQVCYKNTELSYCKLCNITLTTHNEYKTHLFSLEHINQIGYNTLEKINKPNDKTIHSLDPYLNKNEVKNISSKNLGSSFTFVYETGSTQTVSLINNETHNETYNETHNVNTTINTNENNDTYNSINNSTDNSINTIIIPEPTLRQTKIINFLEKQIADNKPIQDSGNLFYKMLDNKLQIDDYKNLQKIITHLNINNDYKKTYLDTINLFISFLVKEKTNRKTIYKDKDISQLVINLTS